MAGAATQEWKCFGLNMWQQVILGLTLGVLTGYLIGHYATPENAIAAAAAIKVIGTVFIKLIKMIVAPLILFALIAGITSLTEAHHFKGLAIKGTAAYIGTSVIAVTMGLVLGNIFEPGVGVPLPPSDAVSPVTTTPPSIGEFLMGLIPFNIVHAMANDMYLQVVVFAIFTGIVMNNIRGKTDKVKELNQQMAHITFKMIEWIVRLAPLAVFSFMAAMVATTGMDVITSLTRLVILVIGACAIQIVMFGLIIVVFGRLSPWPFFRKIFPTQVMAFSTSSSKATLTTAMRELQDRMGVSQSGCNFMMPLGACINMDGTAIYLGLCAVFFAQMYGVTIELADYPMLMLTCTLGSMGAAGVPSGSIIFMGMVLASVGIPMEGIGIILGVDRILDMFRTMVNITGDATITLVVAHSEGQTDTGVYYADN